ncbi:MAG: lamin tail domain-containing protein [Oscillospiraceae bacterium]|nr:lamin tail domain-containing protein [Oscillospiraceae bacterium]
MTETIFNKRIRVLTVLVLLFAMLLTACGTVQQEPAENANQAAAEATAVPVAEPEPTPEPTPEPFRTEVVFSELQPSNKATITDADGDFSDWIELYNPGTESEDLSGCWLSDSDKEPCKWQIPSLTLSGGEYKVIFCSKKDRSGDELHTNFSISKDGDAIYLSSPEGEILRQVSYEACGGDVALRLEGESVTESYYPTPGWPNTEEGYEGFIAANDNHGALVINEAMCYNDSFNFHAGGYYDWVELKNVSGEAITLSDYYVTDKSDLPTQFRLPETTLKPGETFVVFCGDPLLATASCHAPFKLSAKGDSFYIYRADGSLCDYISLYGMPLNHSKGRIDGASGFYFYPSPTPAASNGSYCARYLAARPESVTPTGIYNDVEGIDVELSGEGTIYYTVNGNLPDTQSYVYSGPIHLTKTTTIRAISMADSKLKSETATFTYLIDEYHTLPVVCVALEPMKLDVLYNHNGHMEYDSHAEYYDPNGGSFASDCMITLHGAASRSAWDKKSFKIVFRDRYGGDINYDLFGQGITEFHSLNLRGGDTVYMKTYREPLAAEFAERVAVTDPFALDSRFCLLYVNGYYYGIYSLREAYSNKYIESHTGSEEDLNTISRAPIKIEYQPELFSLHNYIISCDISDPDNYNYIADRVDLQSWAQWLLLETYFNNRDTAGNIRYCRGVQPDSKWRTMFFDLDISMENENAYLWEITNPGESQLGRMYTNLLRSSAFQQLLLETASGMYKNGLGHELALEILDRMVEELEPEMDRNLGRWGESRVLMENNLAAQRRVFSQRRDESWLEIVQAVTGASDETMSEYFPERG